MTKLPDAIRKVVEELRELPSIGPRQATRLAFFLIAQGKQNLANLAHDLEELQKVKICERCFFVHQNPENLCDICKNPARRKDIVMIVEKETDLISLENAGKFAGRYLILGPIPKTGALLDWQKLRLQNLKTFIEKDLPAKVSQSESSAGLGGKAEEIILAFNPTSLGDFHASILTKELSDFSKKISRLGRGLPTGGEIEFADDETLGSALERRS